MSVVTAYKAFGGLRIYDISAIVNLSKLQPAFGHLSSDPFLPEGVGSKHLSWFRCVQSSRTWGDVNDLYAPCVQVSKSFGAGAKPFGAGAKPFGAGAESMISSIADRYAFEHLPQASMYQRRAARDAFLRLPRSVLHSSSLQPSDPQTLLLNSLPLAYHPGSRHITGSCSSGVGSCRSRVEDLEDFNEADSLVAVPASSLYAPIFADPVTVSRLLNVFLTLAEHPGDEDDAYAEHTVQRPERVLMRMQRTVAPPDVCRAPTSIEDWHRDGAQKVGILCVARENLLGGLNQFCEPRANAYLQRELAPGFLAVFSDAEVLRRATDVCCADGKTQGHRDVVIMSF